jgi:uroporphyrinogen III methyltransferase / synthase
MSPPRSGRPTVAVTRPPDAADTLGRSLRAWGAAVLEYPLVRIGPSSDPAGLKEAAARCGEFDWVVFTSRNAVNALLESGCPDDVVEALRRVRLAAVGPATAAALGALGLGVDARPERSIGEQVAEAMQLKAPLAGSLILWPRASGAREGLKAALIAVGASVHDVEAYRTLADRDQAAALHEAVGAGRVDVLTFTSPSAVRCYAEVGGTIPAEVRVATIGPVTAGAAVRAGYMVHLTAAEASVERLAEEIRALWGGNESR